MAYFANVYRVNFDTLQKIKGSKDAALLKQLTTAYPDDEDEEYEEDEERPPALSAAFAAIVNGETVEDGSWPTYAVASECIYARVGAQLESNSFSPSHPDFIEVVSQALVSAGLGERISIFLSSREAPLWPEPSLDFPILSHMTPNEVAASRGLIQKQDWNGQPLPVQKALATVARWIDEAAARGEGLVCAYS